MTKKIRLLFKGISICFIVFTIGCASTRGAALYVIAPTVDDLIEKVLDVNSEKLIKEGIPGSIILITGLAELSPTNYRLLKTCSLVYVAYGLMVEDEDRAYANKLYDIGRDYGTRALKLNSKFADGLKNGKKLYELVDVLGEDYKEALFWTGMSIGVKALLNLDDPLALKELPDGVAAVKRSVELDDKFFYGLGKAWLGVFYAVVPGSMGLGGGAEASNQMFTEANAVSNGNLLLIDVFKARWYTPVVKNEELFDKLIKRVLESESSILKNGRALNEISKVKAAFYLKNKENYF